MDIYAQMAEKIIKQQEAIIGPVAIEQAEAIKELHVDWPKQDVTVSGNGPAAIDKLVSQYKELFGKISVEVCKEASAKILAKLSPDQVPTSLR